MPYWEDVQNTIKELNNRGEPSDSSLSSTLHKCNSEFQRGSDEDNSEYTHILDFRKYGMEIMGEVTNIANENGLVSELRSHFLD